MKHCHADRSLLKFWLKLSVSRTSSLVHTHPWRVGVPGSSLPPRLRTIGGTWTSRTMSRFWLKFFRFWLKPFKNWLKPCPVLIESFSGSDWSLCRFWLNPFQIMIPFKVLIEHFSVCIEALSSDWNRDAMARHIQIRPYCGLSCLVPSQLITMARACVRSCVQNGSKTLPCIIIVFRDFITIHIRTTGHVAMKTFLDISNVEEASLVHFLLNSLV